MNHQIAPLLNLSFTMTNDIMTLVSRFPKDLKFSFGEKILEVSLAVLTNISAATAKISLERKRQTLEKVFEDLTVLTLYLRLAHHRKLISDGLYPKLCIALSEIESQAQSFDVWLKNNLGGIGRIMLSLF